jgi:hypothetical protein
VKRLCFERGVNIECIVIDPKNSHRLMERGTSQGRTIFDHTWVEKFYLHTLEQCQKEIDRLQQQASGHGAQHRETRRKAEEISKWNI